MSTATSRLLVDLAVSLSSGLDLASVSSPLKYSKQLDLPNTSASLVFHDQRTLAASATENLDLAGVLTDPLGAILTFTKVRLLLIYAAAANTNLVQVGGHATAAFVNWVADATDVVQVRPGGLLLLTAPDTTGYAVTATTGDMLTITNSAGTTGVTYDIVVLGV